MKRVVALVTFAAALGASGCRQHRDPASAPTETTAPSGPDTASGAATSRQPANSNATLAHPLLWSAAKDGKVTYFLGTMHVGIDAEARLPALVWSKLDAARVFAMEADLDDPQAAAAIQPTAGSLREALGEAYWKKLEDAIGASVASTVEHLPPMVPAAALSMRGLPPTPAMDKVLSARAVREHKPVIFLEPAARQLAILGKWMDVKALKMMLDELPSGEQRVRAMLAAYADGDERALLAISDDEQADALQHGYTAGEYAQEMNEMLYDRNAAWIAAIDQLHAAGGGFVAVGALHLVGPRSVLELLAHEGYQVTRLAEPGRPNITGE
jgi:uncharacterized protein YbaP (TraB family)